MDSTPTQSNPNRSESLPPSMNPSELIQQNQERPQDSVNLSQDPSLNLHNIKRHRRKNDAQLIRNRRVYFNQAAKRDFELRCEEKISKYRLEEAHSSVPSSIKSTFIMTFSPDGQRVASTHGDHRIYICDLNTGKLLDTLEGHPKTPWCLAWHPSNRDILASGCLAGEVRVWDLRSKACESWTSENSTIITSLDFHPRERILVIATANDVLFWDWSQSEPFAKTTTMHEREKVKFVVFDSTGTKLITGISNLPKFAGYSSDSLQSRIIDGYLSPRSIEITAENMTQSSEMTLNQNNVSNVNPSTSNQLDSDGTQIEQRLDPNGRDHVNADEQWGPNSSRGGSGNNEQDINQKNTLVLSRVALLYRQLEALEDSIRHTSFTPVVNISPGRPAEESDVVGSDQPPNSTNGQANDQSDDPKRRSSSNDRPDQRLDPQSTAGSNTNISPADDERLPTSNSFEPYLVTFDESLEQLQLPPLVVEGHTVNLVNVIEQYPLDISYQLNYAMQFESINQVNQNFIRISKLMSSARLYRQIVQQVLSSNSGAGPHHPNQILTVQSVSSRSHRNPPNLPIMLRNLQMGSLFSSGGLHRPRPTDPIMAIQFRNSARNVPLATICKIDLLAARAICIMRSQVLVEHALSENELHPTSSLQRPSSTGEGPSTSNRSGSEENSSYHSILNHLHGILTQINHAPLTTSNAYTYVSSLRITIDRLLKALSSLLSSSAESRKIVNLIHNIAFSLTGRKWSVPLGANLDEIRLDVIHTLCIVDLALHFARQVQLLQMQRISLLARIGESRRSGEPVSQVINQEDATTSNDQATTSDDSTLDTEANTSGTSTSQAHRNKRKSSLQLTQAKRKKVATEANSSLPGANRLVEELGSTSLDGTTAESILTTEENMGAQSSELFRASESSNSIAIDQIPPTERLITLWNNPQNHLEPSLHRFLVATPPSTANRHILVRIYHRLHGNNLFPPQGHQAIADNTTERSSNPPSHHESRRRALSQDHSSEVNDSQPQANSAPSLNAGNIGSHRMRAVRPPATFQVNIIPGQSNYQQHQHIPAGLVLDPWQRHPHLHVYQARGPGQHLWFNQWAVPFPLNSSNYRLQCWNFSLEAIPNINDSRCNIITAKCRIHNDSSVDISSDGATIACLVPRDDPPSCLPNIDLKIFSLKSQDFGACYYRLPHSFNAVSVSLSPSANYAVVGLMSHKFINPNSDEDDLTIAKIYKLSMRDVFESVRDVKIKRTDSALSLNAIRWMSRGIVYNVGPQHHQRYRMRSMMAP